MPKTSKIYIKEFLKNMSHTFPVLQKTYFSEYNAKLKWSFTAQTNALPSHTAHPINIFLIAVSFVRPLHPRNLNHPDKAICPPRKRKPFHREKYLHFSTVIDCQPFVKIKNPQNSFRNELQTFSFFMNKTKQDVNGGSSHVLLRCSVAYILLIWYTALMLR